MDYNSNSDFRKETREFNFSDGTVMTVTGPAYLLEEMDNDTDDNDNNDTSENVSELPPSITEGPDTSVTVSEQPSIETLTAEIRMYLQIANQSIIEVGKRLILAKELVPYGEWKNWLKNNFNLKYRMAANFMAVAERFGNVHSNTLLDISTFAHA